MKPMHGVRDRANESTVAVWCGDYPLRRDDAFFVNAVRTGRLADEKARGKNVSVDRFDAAIEALRIEAPREGRVLVDEIEHRWRYPDAPPTLYVLTCEMAAEDGSILASKSSDLGPTAASTKVGQAKRSLAPRLSPYVRQGIINRVSIAEDSLALRIVIYGDGPAMVLEPELLEEAAKQGKPLRLVDQHGGRRRVGRESFVDVKMVAALGTFACARAVAVTRRAPL